MIHGTYWSRIRYKKRRAKREMHFTGVRCLLDAFQHIQGRVAQLIVLASATNQYFKLNAGKAKQPAEGGSYEEPGQGHGPIGGGNVRGSHQTDLQVHSVCSKTGLYMKKQLRKFGQIHALNALFGKTLTQPSDIVTFCKDHAKKDTRLRAALRGEGIWSPHEGNFADVVINAFLHYHSALAVKLCLVTDRIPTGLPAERFLSGLPADHDAFILSWHHGDEPHQDRRYGHAVCIRKHPRTQQWYLLDSEKGQPVLLTAQEWGKLKGSVVVLAKGSAYNYNSIYGATEEGYTRVVDILEYTTPDKVCISKRPTVGVRWGKGRQMSKKERSASTYQHHRETGGSACSPQPLKRQPKETHGTQYRTASACAGSTSHQTHTDILYTHLT